MTDAAIREAVVAALHRLAPEADLGSLDPEAPLRETLELDSMDFLRLLTILAERLEVDIPDAEAGELATLDRAVRYLAERTRGDGEG